MGMLAAKILGARLLQVPWLFHVSMISVIGGTVALKGKSQPDLVGLRRNGDWVVVEAKGRTLGYSAPAMASAKLQPRQLRQINGSYPSLRVAVQAYFAPRLQWALEDPEEFDPAARDWQFDLATALSMYYSAPMAATQQGSATRRIHQRDFLAKELPEIGVTVAIDLGVRDRVVARTPVNQDDATTLAEFPSSHTDGDFVVFPDGIAISLDERWSEDRMQIQPGARRDG
jgi:hypothetical protein